MSSGHEVQKKATDESIYQKYGMQSLHNGCAK
jgi:hypothetical protein